MKKRIKLNKDAILVRFFLFSVDDINSLITNKFFMDEIHRLLIDFEFHENWQVI